MSSNFRFYITDLINGIVLGTNDEEKATSLASCEDYFVVDVQKNYWMCGEEDIEVGELK